MAIIEQMYALTGTTGTILVFMVTFIAFIYWVQKPRNLPPGPYGLPFVGYLPQLALQAYLTGLDPHELLTKLSKEYGKIYSFDLMGVTVAVISDHKILKEAFQNRNLNNREPNEIATHVYGTSGIYALRSFIHYCIWIDLYERN